jgi:hypothetical protein
MSLFSLAAIAQGITQGVANIIKYRGDVQKARRFVRRRLIAPRLYQLHRKEIAVEVANDIVDYMFGSGGDASILTGLAWFILDKTIFVAKRRLVVDMIMRYAVQLQTETVAELDEDDLTHKFTKGRKPMEKFVKSLLTIVGG